MRPTPPRIARALARALLGSSAREVVVGDLDEAFRAGLAAGMTLRAARRRYWRQALASIVTVRRYHLSHRPALPERSASHQRAGWLSGLATDVRHVARGLARSRGFTIVSVLSLAIGIGANVAVFSAVRALILETLPVPHPSELVFVYRAGTDGLKAPHINVNSDGGSNYSYPEVDAMRAADIGGASLAGFNFVRQLNLSAPGQAPLVASGLMVTGSFFSTLRLPLALGRGLDVDDDSRSAAHVAVVSDALARRLYGMPNAAIGKSLMVNGSPFVVVGVTQPAFRGLSIGGFYPSADVIVTLSAQPVVAPSWAREGVPIRSDRMSRWIRLIARAPSDGPRDALARALLPALRQSAVAEGADPADAGKIVVRLKPASRGLDSLRIGTEEPLAVLAAVSGLVLLIACANLAGMMLARGVARGRETAVRQALGAGRVVLARRWLIEGMMLAAVGGAAGVVAAVWSGPVIARMLAAGLGAASVDLHVDWVLLAAAFCVTLVTAIVCASVPAIRLTGSSVGDLKHWSIGPTAPRLTGGRLLLALQVAVSVPLVVGALLFLRTLHNLAAVDLGFEPHGLVIFQINPTPATPTVAADAGTAAPSRATVRALIDRLEAIPGVTTATVLENALVSGWMSSTTVTIDGTKANMWMNAVGPHFTETMKIPLVAGRELTLDDDASAPGVVLVNEAAARRYFPRSSPIGRSFRIGSRQVEIVGVVGDTVYDSLRHAPRPVFYDAYLQRPGGTYMTTLAVRSAVAPVRLTAAISKAVAAAEPGLAVANLRTQDDQIDQSTGKERVFGRLLTLFGAVALLLAAIGLHGLAAYSVARRTSEIGIRLALGASRRHVFWLILGRILLLALAGLAVGLPLALACGRLVASMLFGVTPADGGTILAASVLLAGVAVAAGLLPARRASRMEALAALRAD